MFYRRIRGMAVVAAMLWAFGCFAQTDTVAPIAAVKPIRPVTSTYYVEGGSAHLADTYLTPLKYTGWHAGIGYYRRQAMRFSPHKWVMQIEINSGLNCAKNPARNATMWDLDIHASWAMMRRWKLSCQGLSVGVGGATQLNLGALYLARNGNNPVAAKADWTIDATAYTAYTLKIKRLPLTLRYQATVPVIGCFFSPDYGELYYEIYLGNHKGLAHMAWPGNFRKYQQRLTADMHFGATTLTVGYQGELFSSKVNHITTRRFTHSLMLGITCEWIALAQARHPNSDAMIITANY